MSIRTTNKQPSTVLVGMSALFVVVAIAFIAFGVETGASMFGAVLLGVGVLLGITGAVLNLARR